MILNRIFFLSVADPFFQILQNAQSYAYHQQIYDFLAGVAYHEVGHSKQCPIDSTNFSRIIQAITAVLEQKGGFGENRLAYFANLFLDLVVNTIFGLESKNSFFRNAIFIHHMFEMEHSSQSRYSISLFCGIE